MTQLGRGSRNASNAQRLGLHISRARTESAGLLSTGLCFLAASGAWGQISSAEAVTGELIEARQEAPRSWMARLIDVMDLQPGMTAADIGAGEGRWAARMARHVGPEGQVFATEIVERLLGEIRRTADELSVDNVVPVLGSETDASLPPGCCDRILARLSYHEFGYPDEMGATMFEALKPGGLLVIIENSGGHAHAIAPRVVIPQLSAAGFEFIHQVDGWDGRSTRYLQLYRKR
jgi:ubiquinone/menaquinone biosynthesis C-methylase UbiE